MKTLTTLKTKQKVLIKKLCPCERLKKIVEEIINTTFLF